MPRPEQSDTLEQVGIILQSRPEDKIKNNVIKPVAIRPATPTYQLISTFSEVLWSHPCGGHICNVTGNKSLF